MKGSDNQEKLVYQIIEDAGNKGETPGFLCWSRRALLVRTRVESDPFQFRK